MFNLYQFAILCDHYQLSLVIPVSCLAYMNYTSHGLAIGLLETPLIVGHQYKYDDFYSRLLQILLILKCYITDLT